MAVYNNPDAFGLRKPIPSIAKMKIVGNIIELNKPTAKILHILTKPVVLIDINIRVVVKKAKIPSAFPGFIILIRQYPAKRPTIAPDQYTVTNTPAMALLSFWVIP
ncbi:MAG: hypothetical protein HRT66_12295 [Flavobacteriaceae bacterium]|nr:hypothetical protein [Flavobacteriaceae bacterium]